MTRQPPSDFDQRVARFAPVLRAFVRRRVSCPATADDLAQETLLKALRARESLRQPSRLEAWLYQAARRTVIDHYRRTRAVPAVVEELVAEAPEENRAVTDAVARAARCYLGTLPPIYQEAVRLAEEEGLPLAEVARRLGISVTAAKSRVRRGKQQVRALIEACCALTFDARGRVVDCEVRRRSRCG
jgi:RNA polymerase sigma-70 factor (ECF subfamily)